MNWKKRVFENFKLVAVTDLTDASPRTLRKIEQAYRGGADMVQLRTKVLSDADFYRLGVAAREIANRCRKLLFVNDRPDLALAIQADGVHVGQDDLPLESVRRILGRNKIYVGRSTHSLRQALMAEKEGSDYIGVGPIFATPTKPHYRAVGFGLIRQVERRVRIPFVCIGGINAENLAAVLEAGAWRVAVVRAIFGAPDVYRAARQLSTQMKEQ